MSRSHVRSRIVAPKKKGPRSDTKVRMPKPLKMQLDALTALHESSANDEITSAIDAHIRAHDPATCANIWCVAKRKGNQ